MSGAIMTEQSPFEALGGEAGVRRLAERFYQIMAMDESAAGIRGMHAPNLEDVTEKLTGFLTGWLGGPRHYFERADAPCIMSVHKRLPIGEAERDQWLACMRRALIEIGASPETQTMLEPAFARIADSMRSR